MIAEYLSKSLQPGFKMAPTTTLLVLFLTLVSCAPGNTDDLAQAVERSLYHGDKRWSIPLGHQYIGLGKKRGTFTTGGRMAPTDVDSIVNLINSYDISPTGKLEEKLVSQINEHGDRDFPVSARQQTESPKYKAKRRTRRRYKTFFNMPHYPIVSRRMALSHRSSPVNPVLYYLGIGR